MEVQRSTAPAWQVRESKRQQLLEQLRSKIYRAESRFGRDEVLQSLLSHFNPKTSIFWDWNPTLSLGRFNFDLWEDIKRFERTEEEGMYLISQLFVWAAQQIAEPYEKMLRTQETLHPSIVLGSKSATEEIPLDS